MENSHISLSSEIRIFIAHKADISQKVHHKCGHVVQKGIIPKIYKKYKETGNVEDLWRSSRSFLFSEEEKMDITKASQDDRKLTAIDISKNRHLNKHDATPQTIRNILGEDGLIASSSISNPFR